jgi:acyl carrier protein
MRFRGSGAAVKTGAVLAWKKFRKTFSRPAIGALKSGGLEGLDTPRACGYIIGPSSCGRRAARKRFFGSLEKARRPARSFRARAVRRIQVEASVQERVIDIVSNQLGVAKEQITPETSFINDLGADSLDTVELVMELEEEFEINIPDDAAEKIQTVGQAVEFIQKQQA